jgi:hypothetical protein
MFEVYGRTWPPMLGEATFGHKEGIETGDGLLDGDRTGPPIA